MTSKHKGRYSEKHPSDRKANPQISEAVSDRSSDGEIPCAVAFDIADHFKTSPEEVGFTIDSLEIKVMKCQLGLFGYGPKKKGITPAETVSASMEEAIRQHLINGRLPCVAAWKIAERQGIKKTEVSSACEALKVKISPCQLGTF